MTQSRLRIGRLAEQFAADRLAAAEWKIVERNARTRHGELDIVALDGGTLVFVEVKAGRAGANFGPERPILSIGPRKQLQVRRLATAWMADRRPTLPFYAEIRFDAIGVTYDRERVVDFEHISGAF